MLLVHSRIACRLTKEARTNLLQSQVQLFFSSNNTARLHIPAKARPPPLKIPRKPLPVDSSYSPGSPTFTSRMLVATPRSPKHNSPILNELTTLTVPQASHILSDSIESVSLGPSNVDTDKYHLLPPTSPTANSSTSRLLHSNNGYIAVVGEQSIVNPFMGHTETNATFTMRPKPIVPGPFWTHEIWIIFFCVILLVIAFVAIVVGIAVSNPNAS